MVELRAGSGIALAEDTTAGTLTVSASGGGGGSSTVVTPQQFQVSSGLALPLGGGVQDDSAAFVAAIAYLKSIALDSGWVIKSSPKLFIPAGNYNVGTTTLDITHTLIVEGENGLNGLAARLKWTGDCDGIRTQEYNTSGKTTVDGVTHISGRNAIIRNIALCGPYEDNPDFTGNTESDNHAIRVKANVTIEDVFIDGWAGDGVHALTSSGAGSPEEGNSNVSFINRLRVTNVRNGVYLDGADANAWTTIGVYGTYCRQHTIYDSSFLGNNHIGPHSANAGLVPGVPPCVVNRGGNRYGLIQGQATGASTNAPPSSTVTITIASPGVITWTAHGLGAGTPVAFSTTGALPTGFVAATTYYVVNPTTNTFQLAATVGGSAINTSGSQSGVHTASAGIDNAYWLYMGPGAANTSLNIPAWASGTTYREGGGYRTDSANAANLFLNPYQEGGECPSQFVKPTLVIGGLTGGSRDILTTGNIILGSKIIAPSADGGNKLGATNIFSTSNSLPQLVVHNNSALAAGAFARTDYCQGYEADGVTPLGVARIRAWPTTSSAATAEGVMYFGFRTFGGGGAFTDLLQLSGATGSTPYLAPITDNALDLGLTGTRWKNVFAYVGSFTTSVTIGGGTPITKTVVYTPSITPASVAAATVAEQTFTVAGLTTADKVIVNPPAIANATGIVGARVSAADTLAIRFVNPTAGALTPSSGTYTVIAIRS